MASQTELIETIQCLFIQLRLSSNNSENTNETCLILHELTNTCNRVLDRKYHTTEDVMMIFEVLLKNYLLLVDSDEFVEVIARKYSLANNEFLTSFYHSLEPNDVAVKIGLAKYTDRIALFTRLLDQISSSTRIISFLKSEVSSTFDNDEDTQRIVDCTSRILLLSILPMLSSTNVISIRLSVIKLKKYENTFFNLLIGFLDKQFSENKPSENDALILEILRLLCMISKETATIPILINIDCPQACLRWLSLSYLKSREYKFILIIVKNIARHDEGAEMLNESKCGDICTKFIKDILCTKMDYLIDLSMHRDLLFTTNMIIFLTADPSSLYSAYNCELICKGLIPAIDSASSSPEFTCVGYGISELLIVLMRLFTNDHIVDYVLEKNDRLDFFFRILTRISDVVQSNFVRLIYRNELLLSIIILANIFWSISFQERYRINLLGKIELMTGFESFLDYAIAQIFFSRQIFPLRRAIDGIRQNLCSIESTAIGTTRSLVISYSYLDGDIYRKLYEILSKHSKFSICAEAENWNQIAQNIEQADLLLLLISNKFSTNKSCRQELIYARDVLGKSYIPIYIDRKYQPIDWLEKRLDGLQSIRYDEGNFDELLVMINGIPATEKDSFDIRQWNSREVKKWFTDHHLLSELQDFYQFQNGNELILYAQAISTSSWTREYERIRSRFEKKFHDQGKSLSPHEFLKFVNALERVKHLI